MKITEANCQDDGCAEVIVPNILFIPLSSINLFDHHPVVAGVDLSDRYQYAGDNMSYYKIQGKHFAYFPVTFIVSSCKQFLLKYGQRWEVFYYINRDEEKKDRAELIIHASG